MIALKMMYRLIETSVTVDTEFQTKFLVISYLRELCFKI